MSYLPSIVLTVFILAVAVSLSARIDRIEAAHGEVCNSGAIAFWPPSWNDVTCEPLEEAK